MTPLNYAARDGRVEEAQLLLAAGADVELAEANGMRPLLMALLNNQLAVARLLLAHGADVNADDFWGRTPLFAAVDYRNLDMNNRDEDAPTTNYVDREPLLDVDPRAHRARRRRQRAHARSPAEPPLAVFARRRVVGRLHGADAVPARGAVGRHRGDALAARARRRSESVDVTRARRR